METKLEHMKTWSGNVSNLMRVLVLIWAPPETEPRQGLQCKPLLWDQVPGGSHGVMEKGDSQEGKTASRECGEQRYASLRSWGAWVFTR